ncbi:MAG: hypothetical protein ACR2M4_00535 [Actinomycetota bacterium]
MRQSPRKQAIISAIRVAERRGVSLSYSEIADMVGLAGPSSVFRHLQQLQSDGLVKIGSGHRQVRLAKKASK